MQKKRKSYWSVSEIGPSPLKVDADTAGRVGIWKAPLPGGTAELKMHHTTWHKTFIMTLTIRHHVKKFVMTSKRCVMSSKLHDVKKLQHTSWRQKVCHNIKKWVITSKSSSWRASKSSSHSASWRHKVSLYVKKSVIMSKSQQVCYDIKAMQWRQKVRHDVKNTSWRHKLRHDVKNNSKVRYDVKNDVFLDIKNMTSKSSSWCRKHIIMSKNRKIRHHVKKFTMASTSLSWQNILDQFYISTMCPRVYMNDYVFSTNSVTVKKLVITSKIRHSNISKTHNDVKMFAMTSKSSSRRKKYAMTPKSSTYVIMSKGATYVMTSKVS